MKQPIKVAAKSSGRTGTVPSGSDLNRVIANMQPGDVVTLTDGTYDEIRRDFGGLSLPGAIMRGSRNVRVKGINPNGLSRLTFADFHVAESLNRYQVGPGEACDGLVLDNLLITSLFDETGWDSWDVRAWNQRSTRNGVNSFATNLVVRKCKIARVKGGITLRGKGSVAERNEIEWVNGDALRAFSDTQFLHNTVRWMVKTDANHTDMFQAGFNRPANNIAVFGNTLSDNPDDRPPPRGCQLGSQGIYFDDQRMDNITVQSNTVRCNRKAGIYFWGGITNARVIGNTLTHNPNGVHKNTMMFLKAGCRNFVVQGNTAEQIFIEKPIGPGMPSVAELKAQNKARVVSR